MTHCPFYTNKLVNYQMLMNFHLHVNYHVGLLDLKISSGGFICWNCDGGLKSCLNFSKLLPSFSKHEIILGLLQKKIRIKNYK